MSLAAMRVRVAARRADLHARRIIVLAGGASAEREVSLSSGNAVASALGSAGYHTQMLEVPSENPLALNTSENQLQPVVASLLPALRGEVDPVRNSSAIPLVVSMLHGAEGENGTWQGLLELLNLPYMSAGVQGSALAMNKALSKRLFEQMGIPTPRWCTLGEGGPGAGVEGLQGLQELVAKPMSEGSSVGLLIFHNTPAGWRQVREHGRQFGELLVEERILGRELTLSIVGNGEEARALPLIEIRAQTGVYDYANKYTAGASEYICPAELNEALAKRIVADGKKAYHVLNLAPCARFDVLLDVHGCYFFLEANTLPGFTPTSLLPKAASAAGVGYTELLELLMLCGLERWEARQARRDES